MNKELFQGQSFYEVLGLSQEASADEVSEAYEAKREELDCLEEIDEVVLQRAVTLLERAHGTLIDDARRAEYDETLEELLELDAKDAIQTALREYDSTAKTRDAEKTEKEETPAIKSSNTAPRLSGRMKATVTVPLSTITRAMREGGDLDLESLGANESLPAPETKPAPTSGVLIDRRNPEGEVSSYGSISQSLEASKKRNESEEAQAHTGHPRNRRPSLEIPRSSVAHLTNAAEDESEQKAFIDYFLIFCAFILPVATVLLTIIHFLLPEQ